MQKTSFTFLGRWVLPGGIFPFLPAIFSPNHECYGNPAQSVLQPLRNSSCSFNRGEWACPVSSLKTSSSKTLFPSLFFSNKQF
jgi:hypothetical protein